jgi:hypothetical protein
MVHHADTVLFEPTTLVAHDVPKMVVVLDPNVTAIVIYDL